MGVFLRTRWRKGSQVGCPHIRGGVPYATQGKIAGNGLSPHTWGCSDTRSKSGLKGRVVPTYVGVFRFPLVLQNGSVRCPHIRGGVPASQFTHYPPPSLSPHTWGCSEFPPFPWGDKAVVPTYVGVFLRIALPLQRVQGCPHIRGGVPNPLPVQVRLLKLSPHTWGCSSPRRPALLIRCRCPHIRGGVPRHLLKHQRRHPVVPTYVGVFLRGVYQPMTHKSCPHIRGGVPPRWEPSPRCWPLSPHTWGCSSPRPAG